MAEIQAYQQDKNSVGTPSGTSISLKEITRTDISSKSYLKIIKEKEGIVDVAVGFVKNQNARDYSMEIIK